jgi:hypothetical protein
LLVEGIQNEGSDIERVRFDRLQRKINIALGEEVDETKMLETEGEVLRALEYLKNSFSVVQINNSRSTQNY